MLVPAVMAMAYGLLFATLMTLLFVPCLYLVNNDINTLLGTGRHWIEKWWMDISSSGMFKR